MEEPFEARICLVCNHRSTVFVLIVWITHFWEEQDHLPGSGLPALCPITEHRMLLQKEKGSKAALVFTRAALAFSALSWGSYPSVLFFFLFFKNKISLENHWFEINHPLFWWEACSSVFKIISFVSCRLLLLSAQISSVATLTLIFFCILQNLEQA